jgi:PhnB protein
LFGFRFSTFVVATERELAMTKSLSPVPEGFRNVTPYLVVRGVARLLDFLKTAFHAEETVRAEEPGGAISHAAVKLGDSMVEMGDVGGTERQPLLAGLHYYVRDVDSVYNSAIQAGAKSLHAPRQMDYGDREAGVEDPAGNHWYIATHTAGSSYRPDSLQDLTPYLTVKGAADFLCFVQSAFGAKTIAKHATNTGTIAHATFQIGDTFLELSDAHGQWGPRTVALHYYTPNCDEVFAQAQRAGANLYLPMKDQFYGDRAGGLLDNWGNHWYIATHTEDLSMDEIYRRASAGASKSAS